jgi:hypothetical protein
MIYANPSFLCSLYGLDGNSPRAELTYRADARRPLFLTPWQRFEVRNAMRLAVHQCKRAKRAITVQIGSVFKQIQEDLALGRLRHAEVDWRESMRLAEELSAEHTEATGAGSVDAWHVAAAMLLEADTFWTFDQEQRELAVRAGLFKRVPSLKV